MFFYNYSKPGKGVNKRDPNQPRWQIFLDIYPRKLWDLFKLNLLYLISALPFFAVTMVVCGVITSPIIDKAVLSSPDMNFLKYDILLRFAFSFIFMMFVGIGPATAGFAYIIREYANEHHCNMMSDYFERFKSNFKQSIILWVIDLIVLYVFSVAIRFYGETGKIVFQYILIVVSVIYVMMHIYIYPMMITFDLPLKHILKNSCLIALGKAPMNLLILGLNVLLYIIIPFTAIMHPKSLLALIVILFLEVFVFPPITNFITGFSVIPVLNKYVNAEK